MATSFLCSHNHPLLSDRHRLLLFVRIHSSTHSSSSNLSSSRPLCLTNRRQFGLQLVAEAADSTQSSSAVVGIDGSIVPDEEFSLAKIWFWSVLNILPGSEWSAIMLTYGFPLAIIDMALKYAELKPVPFLTYTNAQALREKCATPILKQVRDDVIRYRYGDEQHMEEALKRIFQYGQGGGIPRRSAPILQSIREEVNEDGKYSLVLVFEAKALELSDFEKRQVNIVCRFEYTANRKG